MSQSNEPPQGSGQGSGGTPPPPPPTTSTGYGQAPPPPPGPPGGPAAGGYRIGEAFNYGWAKFQANLGPILLAALAIFAVYVVFALLNFLVTAGLGSAGTSTLEYNPNTGEFEGSAASGGFFGASLFVSLLFGLVAFVLGFVVQAGITKGALSITYGRKLELGEMFKGINFGQVALAALILGVLTVVGLVLCILPGIVVIAFTFFTMYFIIDKNLPAVEAIKASVSFVNKNLGTLIGFFLASLLAYFVGALLCGIGLLVAIPVVIIAQAYTYRSLQGEPVAP